MPKNLGVDTFPDPVGHIGFCRRCGVAVGEQMPPSPQGWYFLYTLPSSLSSIEDGGHGGLNVTLFFLGGRPRSLEAAANSIPWKFSALKLSDLSISTCWLVLLCSGSLEIFVLRSSTMQATLLSQCMLSASFYRLLSLCRCPLPPSLQLRTTPRKKKYAMYNIVSVYPYLAISAPPPPIP